MKNKPSEKNVPKFLKTAPPPKEDDLKNEGYDDEDENQGYGNEDYGEYGEEEQQELNLSKDKQPCKFNIMGTCRT